jgi:predicted PurR-regulated permease PerM
VLIGLVLLFIGVGWVTTAALVDQSDELSENLNKAVADINGWLDDTPVNQQLVDQIRETANDAGPAVTGGLGSSAVSVLDSAVGFVAGLILGTIVLYYLLKDLPKLGAKFLEKQEDAEEREVLERIGERTVYNVQNYFRGWTARVGSGWR